MEYQVGPLPPEQNAFALFLPAGAQYNKPSRIVTLGHYYPKNQIEVANHLVREPRATYHADAPSDLKGVRQNLGWTKLLNALADERQWPLKRLFALLDPLLERDIAISVVPTHLAYQAFWPMRTLARQLAE